jgi:hypothetical protein
MKKSNLYILASSCLFLSATNISQADDKFDEIMRGIGIRDKELFNSLGACEFKVVWDSIKDHGKIDDDQIGMGLAFHCVAQLDAVGKIISPSFLTAVIFHNLAFARQKYEKEGRSPFEMYESFDYTGEIKKN